ncbi:hypothetical protein GGG16DRAFT_100818 [Schizophyllum commune]
MPERAVEAGARKISSEALPVVEVSKNMAVTRPQLISHTEGSLTVVLVTTRRLRQQPGLCALVRVFPNAVEILDVLEAAILKVRDFVVDIVVRQARVTAVHQVERGDTERWIDVSVMTQQEVGYVLIPVLLRRWRADASNHLSQGVIELLETAIRLRMIRRRVNMTDIKTMKKVLYLRNIATTLSAERRGKAFARVKSVPKSIEVSLDVMFDELRHVRNPGAKAEGGGDSGNAEVSEVDVEVADDIIGHVDGGRDAYQVNVGTVLDNAVELIVDKTEGAIADVLRFLAAEKTLFVFGEGCEGGAPVRALGEDVHWVGEERCEGLRIRYVFVLVNARKRVRDELMFTGPIDDTNVEVGYIVGKARETAT